MKKVIDIILFLTFILTLIFGNITFQSAFDALMIWFEKLIPSMFISMVLVRILYKQHIFHHFSLSFLCRLTNIDRKCFPLVICSMFLGFPTGALFVDEALAKGHIDDVSAKRLIYTCSFATPGFVIMSCGYVLYGSLTIGFLLFLTQVISGFLLLFFTRHTHIRAITNSSTISSSLIKDCASAMVESGKSLYMIGGYLMLFTSITSVLFSFLPQHMAVPLRIVSEFSSGIILLSSLDLTTPILLLGTCALLSFGGFCVHMQVISMVDHCKLSYAKFLLYRILQSCISLLLFSLFLQFLL